MIPSLFRTYSSCFG